MLEYIILKELSKSSYTPKTYNDFLNLDFFIKDKKDLVIKFLNKLIELNILYVKDDKYVLAQDIFIGTFHNINQKYTFVTLSDYTKVYISENTYNTLDGDLVVIKLINSKDAKKIKGNILYVSDYKNRTILGTYYEICYDYAFVMPLNKNIKQIFISKTNKIENIKHKDYVLCEIKKEKKDNNLSGKVLEIIKPEQIHKHKIVEIINNYNISTDFNNKIIKELEGIPTEVTENDIKNSINRIDLRNRRIITVDGDNTKDFDDAISISILPNGNYLLGVHIADVCEYVKENSYLDKEALKRGVSIYLPHKVIPMLPEKLSNGICSLNPKVNRFTITCDMEINKNGDLINSSIYQSVIKTCERMTYNNFQKILDKDIELCDKYNYLIKDIYLYKELKDILINKRKINGYINFKSKDLEISTDKNNIPYLINFKERNEATDIIEEFMILCNETISTFFSKINIPFIYRVHEEPNLESLSNIIEFSKNLKYNFDNQKYLNINISNILEEFKNKSEYYKLDYVIKRNLPKAKYSTKAYGHFGLGIKYYSHFTSPIRRYPDLQIHRIIKDYLNNRLSNERIDWYNQILPNTILLNNESEILSFKCESAIQKYMLCLYLYDKVGENYNGTISSIIEKGIFIKLENGCEGFIPISTLNDKSLVFDDKNYCFYNKENILKYSIGDKVKVKVNKVDLQQNKVYLKKM